MNEWQWQSWEGLPYLTCSLLQNWSHGFFTQKFWPCSPEALVGVLQTDAQAYRVRQVHGNRVITPSEIEAATGEEKQADEQTSEKEKSLQAADGILTEQAQQAVWVASADCTPVLIGDVETGQVAAVHAGWRGTASRIVPGAIARLLAAGSSVESLRIALGPAIAGEVYQVSEQVVAEVVASLIPPEKADTPETILKALQQLPDSPLLDDPKPGRMRLDLRRVNGLQIEQLGISDGQVAIAPYCTYQQPEYFFSYRRSKQKKVQWSGIVSKVPNQ